MTQQGLREAALFFRRIFILTFIGGRIYFWWMASLAVLTLLGVYGYAQQIASGLAVTGMTQQISWGLYIANFTFVVGLAAAAVMLVIPAYIYDNHDLHDVVILGELIAVASIFMCLMFVNIDLGRLDRGWHILPGVGVFNWPASMLAWDVIVLFGYLGLNVFISGYLLYTRYLGVTPNKLVYMPFVLISIGWAISIHTVTAFLYVGLIGRPFWNAAIVAPRFIGSAFTAGPGLMIVAFQFIRRYTGYNITDGALQFLRQVVSVALFINLFLLGCEAFKEFYAASSHSASAQYLFFGLHGHYKLVPWIWTAITIEAIAAAILVIPRIAQQMKYLNTACILSFVGIWIEKGMGMIIPGFIPTPLGEIVEYSPTFTECIITLGIWACGAMIATGLLHVAIPILSGTLHRTAADDNR